MTPIVKSSVAILTTLLCLPAAHAGLFPYTFDLGGSGKVDVEFSGTETGNVWSWELSSLVYDRVAGWDESSFTFMTGSTADPLFGLSLVSKGGSTPRLEIYDDFSSPDNYDGILTYFARLPSATGDSVSTGTVTTKTPEPNQTPEPASLALLGLGLTGLAWMRRRQA